MKISLRYDYDDRGVESLLKKITKKEWRTFFEEHFKPFVRQYTHYGDSCENLEKVIIGKRGVCFDFSNANKIPIGGIYFVGFYLYYNMYTGSPNAIMGLEEAWKQFLERMLKEDYNKLYMDWKYQKDLKYPLIKQDTDNKSDVDESKPLGLS